MLTIQERIKELMSVYGIKQSYLCKKTGLTSSFISQLIQGKKSISFDNLIAICSAMNVTLSEFFQPFGERKYQGFPRYLQEFVDQCRSLSPERIDAVRYLISVFCDNPSDLSKSDNSIARLSGAAAAGRPMCDEADADSSVAVPRKYCDSSRYLIFQARGDSMVPRIPDGSYVVIQRDAPPEDGDIAVVRVASSGDDEYAIKRFFRRGDRVELRSFNPAYAPMIYSADDVQSADRVVAFLPAPSAQ